MDCEYEQYVKNCEVSDTEDTVSSEDAVMDLHVFGQLPPRWVTVRFRESLKLHPYIITDDLTHSVILIISRVDPL